MATNDSFEPWIEASTAYHRDVALAQLDVPPGEAREARLSDILASYADLCVPSALMELRTLIDGSPEAQRNALLRLWSWGAAMRLQTVLQPHRRAMLAQQWGLMCRVDDELIPVTSSFASMAAESRRDRRGAIETAVAGQLLTLHDHFEAQVEALRHAAGELGYPSLEPLWTDITGTDLTVLQEVATGLLGETESTYVELLTWAAQRRLRLPAAQLRRHDMLVLFAFPDYQKYYQPGLVIPSLEACLQDMGIDPRADGRLVWRGRPATWGPPTAVAVQIPDEIVLNHGPVSGLQGTQALSSALGRALLWSYASADLSALDRRLGDAAIGFANAQWLADTVSQPLWLRHYARLGVDNDYTSWQRLDRLYRFRRQLGRFLYTCHVYTSDSLADAAEAYRDIMMEACRVDYASAYYLVDWDWQLVSLAFWRGWSLAYVLLNVLPEQFGSDWFRNPECGEWLMPYWSEVLPHSVETVRSRLLGGDWDASLLVEALCEERLG
jgi:hypothetical protein